MLRTMNASRNNRNIVSVGVFGFALSACSRGQNQFGESSDGAISNSSAQNVTTSTSTDTDEQGSTNTTSEPQMSPCPHGDSAEVMFADAVLHEKVCAALELSEDCTLTCAAAQSVRRLDADAKSNDQVVIGDISGISQLTNLEVVNLGGRLVTSGISELAQLEKLRYVDLRDSFIDNAALVSLTSANWIAPRVVIDVRSDLPIYECGNGGVQAALSYAQSKGAEVYSECSEWLGDCMKGDVLTDYITDSAMNYAVCLAHEQESSCAILCEDVVDLKSLYIAGEYESEDHSAQNFFGLEYAHKLLDLRVSYHDFSQGSPEMAELDHLWRLDCSSNQLGALPAWVYQPHLRELDLSSNEYIEYFQWEGLEQLEWLQANGIGFTTTADFSPLANLRYLSVSINPVVDLAGLEAFPKLKHLELEGSGLTNLIGLEQATGLQVLNLESNDLVEVQELAALTDLRSLTLADNLVSDVSALSALAQLDQLDLSVNQLSSKKVRELASMPWVSEGDQVDVRFNAYNCVESQQDQANINAAIISFGNRGVQEFQATFGCHEGEK